MFFYICLAGCSGSDIVDQIENYSDKNNQVVLAINNATLAGQVKTFAETFDNFFSSPTWKQL